MALIRRSLLWGSTLLVALAMLSCSSETSFRKKPVPVPGVKLEEKSLAWRGGPIGGALGGTVNGKVTEIIDRASRESAKEGNPVVYMSLDSYQRVEVHPVKDRAEGNCRLLHVEVYQRGTMVLGDEKEVCW
jgi:hypothetical protein